MQIRLQAHTNGPLVKTEYSANDILFLLLVFLGAVNIFNRITVLFFLAFGFILFTAKKLVVSMKIVPILLFSVSLLLFWDTAHYTLTTLLSVFTYPLCYICGYNFLSKKAGIKVRERAFYVLIFVLAFGAWVHMVLNAIISRDIVGNRNTNDVWTGEMRSATGQAGLGLLMVGVSIAMLFSDMRRLYKLAAAALLIFVMWYNLVLAGRTLVLIATVVLVAALVYRFFVVRKKNIKALRAVLLSALVITILYFTNTFGIRDTILESNLYQRFTGDYAQGITEDARGDYKLQYLRYLLDYPFGGANIREIVGGYAHDLYLDTYDEVGVFAFAAIVIMVIQSLWMGFRFFKSPRFGHNIKLLLFCVSLCFHMFFFAEPILAGAHWLLLFYCFVYGALTCIMEKTEKDSV